MNPERTIKYDLESRLIEFGSRVINVAESLPDTTSGKHLSGQLVRSGTAPALNYGEAQAAESRPDFIHKMKIALKELRETMVNLKFILKRNFFPEARLLPLLKENDELIAIFIKSISTAQEKLPKGNK
ncbi:MAG: four helix bundle protein [Saprospiraceae bacterium]|nr:four helix bundle protein [Lewinellaceae bacterium]MBP6810096.1 four helix bundle protein [Saprospiraceae bacterium]